MQMLDLLTSPFRPFMLCYVADISGRSWTNKHTPWRPTISCRKHSLPSIAQATNMNALIAPGQSLLVPHFNNLIMQPTLNLKSLVSTTSPWESSRRRHNEPHRVRVRQRKRRGWRRKEQSGSVAVWKKEKNDGKARRRNTQAFAWDFPSRGFSFSPCHPEMESSHRAVSVLRGIQAVP